MTIGDLPIWCKIKIEDIDMPNKKLFYWSHIVYEICFLSNAAHLIIPQAAFYCFLREKIILEPKMQQD